MCWSYHGTKRDIIFSRGLHIATRALDLSIRLFLSHDCAETQALVTPESMVSSRVILVVTVRATYCADGVNTLANNGRQTCTDCHCAE